MQFAVTSTRLAVAMMSLALASALWLGAMSGAGLADPTVVLVMIEEPGCPYCRRWDAEVRDGYLKSPEGRFAPLLRRLQGHPDVARFKGVIYSPTFILVRGDTEVGRIVGYPGADFFWSLLGELLTKAGFKP